MDRNTNSFALFSDRTCNGLANPPTGICTKLEPTVIIEFVNRAHQPNVAFLNEIQERQAAIDIFFRNTHDQAKIGFDHFFLRLLQALFNRLKTSNKALDLLGISKKLFQNWPGHAYTTPVPEDPLQRSIERVF